MKKITIICFLLIISKICVGQNNEEVNWDFAYQFTKVIYGDYSEFTAEEKFVFKEKSKVALSENEIKELLSDLLSKTIIKHDEINVNSYIVESTRTKYLEDDLMLSKFLSIKKNDTQIKCDKENSEQQNLNGPYGINYSGQGNINEIREVLTSHMNFNSGSEENCTLKSCEIVYEISTGVNSYELTENEIGKEIQFDDCNFVLKDTIGNKIIIQCSLDNWKKLEEYKLYQFKNDSIRYRSLHYQELEDLNLDEDTKQSLEFAFGRGDYDIDVHKYFISEKEPSVISFKEHIQSITDDKQSKSDLHFIDLYKPLKHLTLKFEKDINLSKSKLIKVIH